MCVPMIIDETLFFLYILVVTILFATSDFTF